MTSARVDHRDLKSLQNDTALYKTEDSRQDTKLEDSKHHDLQIG